MENNNEVLLKVDHLCQYFRLGRKDLKAVDDVCFEIKKGEAFGRVGESGCGKTTTGRSIIKLYNITSGSVYFKGQRICAGTRSYTDAIKNARVDAKAKIAKLREEKNVNEKRKAQIAEEIQQIRFDLAKTVEKNRKLIADAKHDIKGVDKRYSVAQIAYLKSEYEPKLKAARGNPAKYNTLKREFDEKCRMAKKRKLVTQIQMILRAF